MAYQLLIDDIDLLLIDVIDYSSMTHQLLYCARKTLFLLSCTIAFFSFVILYLCQTGIRKQAPSSTPNTCRRTKFLHLKKMALEPLHKDSKYLLFYYGVLDSFTDYPYGYLYNVLLLVCVIVVTGGQFVTVFKHRLKHVNV